MKGDIMSIPDSVKNLIPEPCCRIRADGKGSYYVYKYHSLKLPNGKWSSSSGDLIGKIVPDVGFVPNKKYKEELSKQMKLDFTDSVTDLAYGQYDLLMYLSNDIFSLLREHFDLDVAAQIYSYALILCANGFVHVDQVNEFYSESILSFLFECFSIKMGKDALNTLLHYLGSRTQRVTAFQQCLIDNFSSGSVAIDGHVVRSMSDNNDLSEAGYKMGSLKSTQINLLIAFDINYKFPLMYKTYRGSSVDKSSCVSFLESQHFTNTLFVVDNGFYSSAVLKPMSENGNSYIIALSTNNKHFKRIKENGLEYTSGKFLYGVGKKKDAFIEYYEEQIGETKRIIIYKDIDENNSTRKSYLKHMAFGDEGYTQEKYESYCEWWGVLPVETTSDESAEEVYRDYKGRWSIETYNNYIKNQADFNGLKFQDYYNQKGFDFIMLVTGIIHCKLNQAVNEMNDKDVSVFDVLIKSGHMRMVLNHDDQKWHLANTRTRDIELLKLLGGYTPQLTFDPLKYLRRD